MKKSLLVTALSLICCTATAESNVSLYGTLDAGISYNNALQAGSVVRLSSGLESGSFVGFKGSEELGSGIKALFALEQGIHLDRGETSSAGTFSRKAYVGVSGDMGTLRLGRQYSPLTNAQGIVDPFEHGLAGDLREFFGTDATNTAHYVRMSNAVNYQTPDTLAGLSGEIAYGFGEQPGAFKQQRQFGVALGYVKGPVQIAYAYHNANTDTAILAGPVFQTHFIGGTYDFGVLKLRAAMDRNTQGASALKTTDYLLGVSIPFGTSAVYADYMHKKNSIGTSTGASGYAIGYTYALSKRTDLYSAASFLDNYRNASLGGTDVPGKNITKLQAGIRHTF